MRITHKQAHIMSLLNQPHDQDVGPPPKPFVRGRTVEREWHLQRDCIAAIRGRQKYDKDLAYMAPGAAQNNLTPAQRGFAKLMGWQAGLADIWLMRRFPHGVLPAVVKWHIVELKVGNRPLSDEQSEWFKWLWSGGIPCDRVDNLPDFLRVLDNF